MGENDFSRRTFLAGAAASLSAVAGKRAAGARMASIRSQRAAAVWTNWAGSVTCTPATFATPNNERQLIDVVREANKSGQAVRVAATGHSFVPLCASEGTLVSLDGLQGVVSTDLKGRTATILAGTKLHQMGEPLRSAGLAMENMGDIDRQGLAGAVSTGTHGTGHGIGNLSTQVLGIRLLTASGELIDCSVEKDPEVFKAAQVSIGALGIMSQLTLRLLPTYRLHERIWKVPFDECMAKLPELIKDNRHFEYFWYPEDDLSTMKTLNPTDAAPDELPDREGERIGHSDLIFPSVRDRKFVEIEFALPEEHGPDCIREVRELMRTKHADVKWPLEYRTLASDDVYLSPAFGRETVTISAHQANTLPYKAFFADVEAIFRNHHGRPHWGKMHTHTAKQLSDLYPKWDQFHEVRRRLDPDGRFMTDYLRQIFA